MKHFFIFLLLCNGGLMSAQEFDIVFDTLIYSEDSTFVRLSPDFRIGETYIYEVVSINSRVEDGDTTSNRNQVSRFSFVPLSMDEEGIDIELFLEESYWKQIVLYDSTYSSWNMDSIPELRLKYLYAENNFSIENHDAIGDYIYKYLEEAKVNLANPLGGVWSSEIVEGALSKCQDSTVIRNWITFSNGVFTLFSYYSFLFPETGQLKYEINQSTDDFSMSTYFVVNKLQLENGDSKYSILEDAAMGKNSSERMFDEMVEAFSQLDSSYNSELYNSETEDSTFVIVDPKGVVMEATSRSLDRSMLRDVVSEYKSVYTVRSVIGSK